MKDSMTGFQLESFNIGDQLQKTMGCYEHLVETLSEIQHPGNGFVSHVNRIFELFMQITDSYRGGDIIVNYDEIACFQALLSSMPNLTIA